MRYESIQESTTFLCEGCRQRFPEDQMYEYLPHLQTLLHHNVNSLGNGKLRMVCSQTCLNKIKYPRRKY